KRRSVGLHLEGRSSACRASIERRAEKDVACADRDPRIERICAVRGAETEGVHERKAGPVGLQLEYRALTEARRSAVDRRSVEESRSVEDELAMRELPVVDATGKRVKESESRSARAQLEDRALVGSASAVSRSVQNSGAVENERRVRVASVRGAALEDVQQ